MIDIYGFKAVFLAVYFIQILSKFHLRLSTEKKIQKYDGHSFIAYNRLKIKLSDVSNYFLTILMINAEPNILDQLCMQFKRILPNGLFMPK